MVYDIASPYFWGKKRLGAATPSFSQEVFFWVEVEYFSFFLYVFFLRNDAGVLGELDESIR